MKKVRKRGRAVSEREREGETKRRGGVILYCPAKS